MVNPCSVWPGYLQVQAHSLIPWRMLRFMYFPLFAPLPSAFWLSEQVKTGGWQHLCLAGDFERTLLKEGDYRQARRLGMADGIDSKNSVDGPYSRRT